MEISSDYLDIDSDKSYELLDPLKNFAQDREIVITMIDLFLKIQLKNAEDMKEFKTIQVTVNYPILPNPSVTDQELYDEMMKAIHALPQDEEEAAMTAEQLLEERDPEGISKLPFDSPKVKEALAEARQYIEKQWNKGEFHKVASCYKKTMQHANKIASSTSGKIEIDALEIKVGYASRSNPSAISYKTLNPQSSMMAVGG